MPRKGDNFRTKEDADVYYFSGTGKYMYEDSKCYFSKGNPPYGVKYEQGGVKTIDQSFADRIPQLGTMCNTSAVTIMKKKIPGSFADKYLSRNFLLTNFSELAHFGSYMVLALSILLYYPHLRKKYLSTFLLCLIGGTILEIVQGLFIFGREASFEDLILNTVGSVVGILLFWMWGNRLNSLLDLRDS